MKTRFTEEQSCAQREHIKELYEKWYAPKMEESLQGYQKNGQAKRRCYTNRGRRDDRRKLPLSRSSRRRTIDD